MAAMFGAMVWHARRRLTATEEAERISMDNVRLLERERRFVQDASHELRTPITVALGHAELIQRQARGPHHRRGRRGDRRRVDAARPTRRIGSCCSRARSSSRRRTRCPSASAGWRWRPSTGGPPRLGAGSWAPPTDATVLVRRRSARGRARRGDRERRAAHQGNGHDRGRRAARRARGRDLDPRHGHRDRRRGPGPDLRSVRALGSGSEPAHRRLRSRTPDRPGDRRRPTAARCTSKAPKGLWTRFEIRLPVVARSRHRRRRTTS